MSQVLPQTKGPKAGSYLNKLEKGQMVSFFLVGPSEGEAIGARSEAMGLEVLEWR